MQSGELKITNHTNGEKCHIKYHAYSYFSREQQRKVRMLLLIRWLSGVSDDVARSPAV